MKAFHGKELNSALANQTTNTSRFREVWKFYVSNMIYVIDIAILLAIGALAYLSCR